MGDRGGTALSDAQGLPILRQRIADGSEGAHACYHCTFEFHDAVSKKYPLPAFVFNGKQRVRHAVLIGHAYFTFASMYLMASPTVLMFSA